MTSAVVIVSAEDAEAITGEADLPEVVVVVDLDAEAAGRAAQRLVGVGVRTAVFVGDPTDPAPIDEFASELFSPRS